MYGGLHNMCDGLHSAPGHTACVFRTEIDARRPPFFSIETRRIPPIDSAGLTVSEVNSRYRSSDKIMISTTTTTTTREYNGTAQARVCIMIVCASVGLRWRLKNSRNSEEIGTSYVRKHLMRAAAAAAGGSVAGATSIKEAAKLTGFVVTYALHGYLHKTGAYRCRVSGGFLPFVFVALSASKKLSAPSHRRASRAQVHLPLVCACVCVCICRALARILRNAI